MSDSSSSAPEALRIGIDGRYMNDRFPGVGRYVYGLLSGLAAQASDHTFVTLVNPKLPNTRFDLNALSSEPSIELVAVDAPTISCTEQITIPRILVRLSLDLVHCPYYVIPLVMPIPYVLTLYDTIPQQFPQHYAPSSRLAINLMMRLATRGAAHVLAISQSARQNAHRHLGLGSDQMTVTHLGVSSAFLPQRLDAIASTRSRYELPDKYVLYVGTYKPHKNLGRLLRAWQQLQLDQSWQLVLAGTEGRRYPAPRDQVADLGLTSSVRIIGAVSEAHLPPLYSGASAFVFPSLHEGFGLPVLEAMACGVPVVCSGSSSLPEIVGKAAVLFDPLDVSDISRSLRTVLEDQAMQETLRQRGLKRACEFSWKETANTTLQVYLAQARGRP